MTMINANIAQYSKEDFLSNYGLYLKLVEVMTAVDKKAPVGACCGRNKNTIIDNFLKEKNRYIDMINKYNSRIIKPKWVGVLYFSSIGKQLNADCLTDEDILQVIKDGVDKNWFDFSKYISSTTDEVTTVEVKESDESKTSETSTKKSASKKKSKKISK